MKKELKHMAGLQYGSNQNPSHIKKLNPFMSSLDIRPDAFVEEIFEEQTGTLKRVILPLLFAEVQSGNASGDYKKTLAKLFIAMIDQLHLPRTYKTTLSQCIGFVFPNSDSKAFVTKVTLKWTNDFRFMFQCCVWKKETSL